MIPPHRSSPLWLLALALLCAPAPAAAQTWGDLRIPGGVQAARQIVDTGTIGGRLDALWLIDVVRRVQGPTESTERIDRFRDYLEYVQSLTPMVKPCPEQCHLVPRSAHPGDRERVKRLLDSLGLDGKDNDQRVDVDTSEGARRKHAWLAALGIDIKTIAASLNAKESVSIPIIDGIVPLPLPDYFRREVFRTGVLDVLAIVGDRKAAWLYAALMACDEGTLETLAGRPGLIARLHDDHPAAFVVAARTLRLRAKRVETPGDPEAIPIWEGLVGRQATDVDRFTRDLLGRDSGRLGYFYSVVAQLDEKRQGFVLGRHLSSRDRARFVDRIYERFVGLHFGWELESSPFLRPDFDPQVLFALVQVPGEGTIGPAWWPSLFERSLDGSVWSQPPDKTMRALKDQPADALWLISWVFDQPAEAAQRFHLVRFAQRQFAAQPRMAAPAMALALASLIEFPVLPLALERMGVTDPSLYHMLTLAARGVTADGEQELAELQRWQTALALFEQVQRGNRSSDATRQKVLTALGSVGMLPKNQRPGSIAAWVADVFLPTYVRDQPESGDRDQVLMEAFLSTGQTTPSMTWEGLEYVFDPLTVTIRTAAAIQRAARVPRLFDVAALHQIRGELEAGVKTTKDIQAIVGRLKGLSQAVDALPVVNDRPAKAVKQFAEIVKNLERLTTRPKEVNRAGRQVASLRVVIDDLTDAAMMSVTYALGTVPTGEVPEMFAARWVRHYITPADPADSKTSIAWQLARSEPSALGGTVLRGSWLGLDLSLAESRLRRVGVPLGSGAATMGETERAALLNRLGMSAPGPADSAAFEAVSNGVVAGRARLSSWITTRPDDRELETALRDAGVPAEDVNAARWLSGRSDRSAFSAIRPTAVYRLGSGKSLPAGWGAIGVVADGCWCAVTVPPGGAQALAGRRGAGLTVGLDTDLAVRLAELLASARLPAATWSAVLPFALQDWLDSVRQFSPEDSESIAVWPRQLDAARLEQYLLMLVADGTFAQPKGALWR